jgi:NAD-dependent SIR2 family protein deacetylase
VTFAQDYRSDPSVRRLASEIGNNSCIIFIGAGVSVAAGFPSWDALEEKMRTEANLKGCYGPLRIADCYKLYVGERDFSNFLRSVFHTEASPTRIHERLAVPTSIYVTTNFDTLMEDALRTHRGHGKVSKIVNTQTSRWVSVSIQSEHPSVLKIHGCAEDNEGYVIGERDYIEYSDNYAHVNRCLTNLFEKSSVLFLGYSLSDRNVSQLLYNVQKLTQL